MEWFWKQFPQGHFGISAWRRLEGGCMYQFDAIIEKKIWYTHTHTHVTYKAGSVLVKLCIVKKWMAGTS